MGSIMAGACVVALLVVGGASRLVSSLQRSDRGAATAAALAVSPSGNDATCRRGTTAACATFQRAYDLARAGDAITVAGGTYAANDQGRNSVTIFGSPKDGSAPVTFGCAGGSVIVSAAWFTIKAFHVKVSGRCFRFHALRLGEPGDSSVTTQDVTVEGAHADGLEVVGARQVTLRNLEVGPNVLCAAQSAAVNDVEKCDPNGPPFEAYYAGSGSTDLPMEPFFHNNQGGVNPTFVVDGSYFHDIQTKNAPAWHTGCALIWTVPGSGPNSMVFRNNRFANCAVNGLLFDHADGVTITGNTFGPPTEPLSNGFGDDHEAPLFAREVDIKTASDWTPTNWLISFNAFSHGMSLDNSQVRPSYSKVIVRRNLLGKNTYCPAGVTFDSNVFAGGRPCATPLPIPYGYRPAGTGIALESPRSAIARSVFVLAARGSTPPEISKALRKSRKAHLSSGSIRRIVQNDFYVGSRVGPDGAYPALVTHKNWVKAQKSVRR